MVDTTLFGIFHRPAPGPVSAHQQQPRFESGEDEECVDHQPAALVVTPSVEAAERSAAAVRHGLFAKTLVPGRSAELDWLHIPVQHAFIGLADPEVWTVTASFSPAGPFEIMADRTGLYRPADFRPTPWSGFAYEVAPDRRTGLVAGTRILTARGEVPVEALLPGDTAMALRGPALLPIVWIGRCVAEEPPIIIEAGALGANRPSRPLYVAADHPIFVDPVPVPARLLLNGTTIRQTDSGAAELFHVDVGRHEVLFAHNLALASTQRPIPRPLP